MLQCCARFRFSFGCAIIGLTFATANRASAQALEPDPHRQLSGGATSAENDTPKVSEFPLSWYILDARTKQRYPGWELIEGEPHRPIRVDEWIGEDPELDRLAGKVVVMYFWSTECGPCLLDLPETGKLATKLRDLGVVFFAMHESGDGMARLPALIRQYKIDYPIGIDRFNLTAEEWEVHVRPLYAIIDSRGMVRGLGVKSARVLELARKLLEEKGADADPAEQASEHGTPGGQTATPVEPAAPSTPSDDPIPTPAPDEAKKDAALIPPDWLEGTPSQRAAFNEMIGQPAPDLDLDVWMNVSARPTLAGLKGKVVLIDFWATWCGPCRAAAPKINALYEKYREQGLVVIGVCHPRQVERMREVAEQLGMEFPVCADSIGKATTAYRVNSFPDYYFIDRRGMLRIADCRDEKLEDAIRLLLSEPAPGEQ